MSLAYYIVLEEDIPGFDAFTNGKALAHVAETLNKTLSKRGHKTLDDYLCLDDPEVDEEFVDARNEEDSWFSPQEGMELISHLKEALAAGKHSPKVEREVALDIEDYEKVFAKAQLENRRWHLALDF